ncbi:MAG: energy transducer TonB [Acidiferrobacterales bacterium]|nr:energy transducer TonB [Acidiferrobacterales bacterium]
MFRSVISILVSSVVTIGLIYGMYALIATNDPELEENKSLKLPDFVHVPKNEDLQVITAKPKRPDEILEQPDIPDVEIKADRIDIDTNLTLGAVKVGINRELKGFNSNDGEYLPIFRAPPVYPRRALDRGLCGWVDLSYTVTSAGTVRDPFVTASTSKTFERAATKAALKYKYKPRQLDGKPVDVPGVTVRIKFEIEGEPCDK